MAQCRNIMRVPTDFKSLMEDYVMVAKDCPKNTSREYSKYLFIKKDECNRCFEEILKAQERKRGEQV